MAAPFRDQPGDAPALSDRAMENLRFIRETMERAGSFTAVPGWGGVVMGLTAVLAAVLAARQASDRAWLTVWLVEAVAATGIAATTLVLKSRAVAMPLFSGPGRKFALAFAPPVLVGAVLTIGFARQGLYAPLPAVWLMLYGTGVVTAGAFSTRVVPVMGLCFMVLGGTALFTPAAWRDLMMALGFGLLHVVFGLVIARWHGG